MRSPSGLAPPMRKPSWPIFKNTLEHFARNQTRTDLEDEVLSQSRSKPLRGWTAASCRALAGRCPMAQCLSNHVLPFETSWAWRLRSVSEKLQIDRIRYIVRYYRVKNSVP